MNIISTEKAPGAIGPYSQGYTVGGLVFTSGQIPVDPATGTVAEGIAAQADQSCRNVGAILEAAGVGFDKVVKTTCVNRPFIILLFVIAQKDWVGFHLPHVK